MGPPSPQIQLPRTMFQLLETRPSIEKQCGVGGKSAWDFAEIGGVYDMRATVVGSFL